jgi:hypothetical protein
MYVMKKSAATLALLLATALVRGETKVRIPVVEDSTIDNLIKVEAPLANSSAVCDRLGLIAFTHDARHTDAQVSLRKLDATGTPGEPVLLKLPKPAGLAKYPNYATGLAFHPTLPLLYVWQDVEMPKDERKIPQPLSAPDNAAMNEFDHLLIYNLEKPVPELLVGLCRAPEFSFSRPIGSIAIDAAGERLYVPNVTADHKPAGTTMASYVLWADGMPVVGAIEEGKPAPGTEKPTPEGRAAHVAAIQAASKANKQALPQRVCPGNGYAFYGDSAVGSGVGFVPIARDVVITGGYHATGIVSWSPEDRTCRMVHYRLQSHYSYKWPAGHPTLPLVFLSETHDSHLFRFEHADGHPTLVPQRADLEATNLSSNPAVMAKVKKIAVGSQNRVIVIGLDDNARFKNERKQQLLGSIVRTLCYSEKFDRLYVAVEKEKKK